MVYHFKNIPTLTYTYTYSNVKNDLYLIYTPINKIELNT